MREQKFRYLLIPPACVGGGVIAGILVGGICVRILKQLPKSWVTIALGLPLSWIAFVGAFGAGFYLVWLMFGKRLGMPLPPAKVIWQCVAVGAALGILQTVFALMGFYP